MIRSFITSVFFMLFIAVLFATAALSSTGHPHEGHPLARALEWLGGGSSGPVEMSRGDITFTRDKKPVEQLSPEELYILAGVRSSNLSGGRGLDPWSMQTFKAVLAYEREHGSIPAVLDEAALRSIPGYAVWFEQEPGMLDVFRNPLTGAWPRLDAQEHSPGDMYIRVLSEAEKVHYARMMGLWDVWFGSGNAEGERLCSPVFYQRIYGWDGPIYESLPNVTCKAKR